MSLGKREPQTLSERLFLVRNEHGLTWGQSARLLGVETLAWSLPRGKGG